MVLYKNIISSSSSKLTAKILFRFCSRSYLLIIKFLGLPRFEELQQVSQCPIIVVSERVPWTVPVPGHHTTRQGGRTTKGRTSDRRGQDRVRGEEAGQVRRKQEEGEREEEEENKETGGGGTGYTTFLLNFVMGSEKSRPVTLNCKIRTASKTQKLI